jgi:phage terminase small subunit
MLETWSKFLAEYIVSNNATDAYMKAYNVSNQKSATESGSRLLKNPEIIKELDKIQRQRMEKAMWTADEILKEIQEIAHSEDSSRAEKLKALELAAKSLGMFRDKVEHSGSLQIIIDKEAEEWAQ